MVFKLRILMKIKFGERFKPLTSTEPFEAVVGVNTPLHVAAASGASTTVRK